METREKRRDQRRTRGAGEIDGCTGAARTCKSRGISKTYSKVVLVDHDDAVSSGKASRDRLSGAESVVGRWKGRKRLASILAGH